MSLKKLFFFSCGSLSLNIFAFYVTEKLAFFYDNKVKTADPVLPLYLVITILVIGRIFDAFSDPYIGNRTDYSKTSIGKRKKYMLLGIPLLITSFVLLWYPPYTDGTHYSINFVYLFIVANTFFTAFTMVAIPYDAHLAEIAVSKKERMTASSYKAVFAIAGIIITTIVISLTTIEYGSLILAAVALGALVITLGSIKEKSSRVLSSRPPFWHSVKTAFKNKNFLRLCLFILCTETACNIFIKYVEYFSCHIIMPQLNSRSTTANLSQHQVSGMLLGVFIAAVITAIPFWYKMTQYYPKKKLLLADMYYLLLVFPLFYFVGFIPGINVMTQGLVYFALVGLGYSAINILVIAKIADASDIHLNNTGQGAQAIHFGVYNFTKKLGLGTGLFIFIAVILLAEYFANTVTGFRLIGPVIALIVLASLPLLHKTDIPEKNFKI